MGGGGAPQCRKPSLGPQGLEVTAEPGSNLTGGILTLLTPPPSVCLGAEYPSSKQANFCNPGRITYVISPKRVKVAYSAPVFSVIWCNYAFLSVQTCPSSGLTLSLLVADVWGRIMSGWLSKLGSLLAS